MITINLLPEELRRGRKKTAKFPGLMIGLVSAGLFLLLTLIFYVDLVVSRGQFKKWDNAWLAIQPHSQALSQLQQQVETVLKPEKKFLEQYVTTQTPLTYKLTWISEFLPPAAWLLEVKLDRKGSSENLFIKGLAIPSKEKSSIASIEGYLHDLKNKMAEANLSLTTTRQKLEDIEVTQFIANFQWGNPSE